MADRWINTGAILSTFSLSVAQFFEWIEGLLPTVSLVLTTLCVGALLIVHIQNARKASLEIKKLKRDLEGEP